jgi:hypothetical protein
MSCPPEDVGGPWGYKDFVDAMSDPEHPKHVEMIHWHGKLFDPNDFLLQNVKFWNPRKRLEIAGLG